MVLNPDCIRDILMHIEKNTDLNSWISISPDSLPGKLNDYTSDEIMYHIKQLELSNLICVHSWYLDGSCCISYLSPDGHQF